MSKSNTLQFSSIKIECLQGDITDQPDVDAIVNAANAQLMPGGGVAGAIHSKAGPGLANECKPLAPIKTGEAVITGAHNLPNKYVIHCLGPVYGVDKPEAKLLANCYRNALSLAEANGLNSIAFPAISTGIFGYPLEEAAQVSFGAVRDFNAYRSLQHVRFVLWSEPDWQLFNRVMEKAFN
jgi:O-acetyl-ADP-ribose deacetylase (regulator of RNase III)